MLGENIRLINLYNLSGNSSCLSSKVAVFERQFVVVQSQRRLVSI